MTDVYWHYRPFLFHMCMFMVILCVWVCVCVLWMYVACFSIAIFLKYRVFEIIWCHLMYLSGSFSVPCSTLPWKSFLMYTAIAMINHGPLTTHACVFVCSAQGFFRQTFQIGISGSKHKLIFLVWNDIAKPNGFVISFVNMSLTCCQLSK